MFPLAIADSIRLKILSLNQKYHFHTFIKLLKHPATNIPPKLLVIVVEVTVISIERSLENLVVYLVLTPHSNSRSKYHDKHTSHDSSRYYDRNRSRYDQNYKETSFTKILCFSLILQFYILSKPT